MRVYLLAIATAAMVASHLDLVSAVTDQSTTTYAQIEGTDKRFLRSYGMNELDVKDKTREEERGMNLAKLDDVIDLKQLDELIDPARINAALGNGDDLTALLAMWHKDPAMSNAIIQRLSKHPNYKGVLQMYNRQMPQLNKNKQPTPFIDTTVLDDALNILQAKGGRGMTDKFTAWKEQGLTKKQLATFADSNPKYSLVQHHYGIFLDSKASLTKRANDAYMRAYMNS